MATRGMVSRRKWGTGRSAFRRELGWRTEDTGEVVRMVRAGFSFKRLAKFQEATELSWSEISRFVGIPVRTLTRRQKEGKLQPDESDRVWRASSVFGTAVALFEGDIAAARAWMQRPQPGLGGETPLDFATTAIGAREVEKLLGRLEHGVFS